MILNQCIFKLMFHRHWSQTHRHQMTTHLIMAIQYTQINPHRPKTMADRQTQMGIHRLHRK